MGHRDFLSITDLSSEEIQEIFSQARLHKENIPPASLAGKSVVLLFEKASTRTRVSFEVGVARMGGHPIVLTPEGSQIARGEPLRDTARILSGYCECIVMRTFGHDRVQEMAEWADVPVINALTDLLHPCQVLADCFTLQNRFGTLEGKKVAWIGDGNNMANSWINAASLLSFELMLACPSGYDPDVEIMADARARGGKITLVRDPAEAVQGAIAVNTDVWASMGQESEAGLRRQAFKGYAVTGELMDRAAGDAVFMHCLPAHRGEEVAEEVLEGPRSIVWEQAENRLYVQEVIMDFLLRHEGR
ncbi:MAG: Ornithine carbamoyltransferase [Deltaproteobacteria bacterium ADurb.BinA179]|jgi:ornithine carbamoyltransferase|nr:ornithine carbamoyltransferase [Pseudomonadota bacterium]OPZ28023.1 MAG: Ornithine carbamoyltransferase [Deltaproteobacteria bacterium ADurb.BinA179]HNU74014.1 ornithine carbamoyltransferase [Deltaproteobacteria bacterium]HOD69664.1 ornithine carbamoyltransferase [Deltaproteobacteria bacterium]HOE72762.1 ornithine carbamoyltransferase [Deltaproteobacteria bacterium]